MLNWNGSFARGAWVARQVIVAAASVSALALGGCGPGSNAPGPPTVEWDRQKYGPEPARRPLSAVEITTEVGWVVTREKAPAPTPGGEAAPQVPATRTARLQIGGMDCGDCQHIVADELGRVIGVRLARISQPPSQATQSPTARQGTGSQVPPEAVVEYDPGKVSPQQIEGTISRLGLWPKPLP